MIHVSHISMQGMIINKIIYHLNLFLFILIFHSCNGNQITVTELKTDTLRVAADSQIINKSRKDTTILTSFNGLRAPTTIKYSGTTVGTILVLPGWNYSDTEWCSKTVLCKEAAKRGFDIVFVEMQRSVYLKEYYKETRKDYKIYPTRSWLMDSIFIPSLKKGLIDTTKPCFVMGLSTGGRGAAMLALEHPAIFKAAATLSGDFCPPLQKDDALMINSLGPYSKFPSRWEGDNNVIGRIKSFDVPIYIGHGLSDKVCPPLQSKNFEASIKKAKPNLDVVTNYPVKEGHNYKYWNSEVVPVLDFFLKHIK